MWKYSLLILTAVAGLVACSSNQKSDFKMPEDVEINNEFLFDLIHLEEFAEHPNSLGNLWNSALIAKCKISEIEFFSLGGNTPDEQSEYNRYTFDNKGNPIDFNYQPVFQQGKNTTGSIIQFTSKNPQVEQTKVLQYFGKSDNTLLKKQRLGDTLLITKTHRMPVIDSIFFIQSSLGLIRFDKVRGRISEMHAYVDHNTSIKQVQAEIEHLGLPLSSLEYSSLSITYLINGVPQNSYEISYDWKQHGKIEQWQYEDEKIIGYKRFIQNTLVKELTFDYDKNGLISNFNLSGKEFEVIYH